MDILVYLYPIQRVYKKYIHTEHTSTFQNLFSLVSAAVRVCHNEANTSNNKYICKNLMKQL